MNANDESLKPLFIPLKGVYYDAFESGIKDTEYRMHGARWNVKTCPPGRRVVLSRGYGKRRRMTGVILKSYASLEPTTSVDWLACYGAGGEAFCIKILTDRPSAEKSGAPLSSPPNSDRPLFKRV